MEGCKICMQIMLTLVLIAFLFLITDAKAGTHEDELIARKLNNDVVSYCVKTHDNWTDRSRCYHEWKSIQLAKEWDVERDFVLQHPEYRGQGEKCETINSTKLLGSIRKCRN